VPYVKLTCIKHIRRGGVLKKYLPGDTIEVGRQTAVEWILDGSAEDPYGQVGPPLLDEKQRPKKGFGLVIRTEPDNTTVKRMQNFGKLEKSLRVTYAPPHVPFRYTCIWRPDRTLTPQLLNYGFLRIVETEDPSEGWDLAAQLKSLNTMARDFGSDEEKEKTEKVIGDLRLPVYDSCLIWARRSEAAIRVIEAWAEELEKGADEYHAFLRALYSQKAALCTLPVDWASA